MDDTLSKIGKFSAQNSNISENCQISKCILTKLYVLYVFF